MSMMSLIPWKLVVWPTAYSMATRTTAKVPTAAHEGRENGRRPPQKPLAQIENVVGGGDEACENFWNL